MKTWERLTHSIKNVRKKWMPAMVMLMAVVILCGILPMTAMAANAAKIKVAGTELTKTGYYTVTSGTVGSKQDTEPAGGSGYVHWDAANHTLTLYGVTVDGGSTSSGIFANGDYTIKLAEGTNNTVQSSYTNAITCDGGSITIEGPGAMTATGATNGIKAQYSVVIKANVTVIGNNGCGIVNSPTVFSRNADPVCIAADVTVSITGSTYGICVEGGYGASPVIDSPNVTIKGGTAAFSVFPYGAPKLSEDIGALAGEDESNLTAYDSASYSTYKCVKTRALATYTISFEANGGTGSMTAATATEGKEYTLPRCGFTAPSNKTFKAWSVGGEEKQPRNKITVSADTTVTAVWQDLAECPTITITGLTAPQAGQSAEEWLDGYSPVFSPDYELTDGLWYEGAFDNYEEMMSYTEGDEFWWNFGAGQSYTLALWIGSETPTLPLNAMLNVPGATSAVYEYWGESGRWYYALIMIVYPVNFTYEVSFDANGGTGTMITAEVNEGEEYTLPECGFTAPAGKQFKAWSVNGEEKNPGDKITINDDITIEAIWEGFAGWVSDGGKRYFYVNGIKATGWLDLSGTWYYFNPRGEMTTGWLAYGPVWYYFNPDGDMHTGFLYYGGQYYYFDTAETNFGRMAVNKWIQDGSKWYYFNASGYRVTGEVTIDGKVNKFDENGIWLGEVVAKAGWVKENNKWFYYKNGAKLTGWLDLSGTWYYFNPRGEMTTGWLAYGPVWYYFNADGVMRTGWLTYGGQTYYFDTAKTNYGRMVVNKWIKDSGKWYYFNASGYRVTNTSVTIGGKVYNFDKDGICLNP